MVRSERFYVTPAVAADRLLIGHPFNTVGQAFELRFKSFLAKGGGGGSSAPQPSRASAPQQALYDDAGGQGYNGSQALYDDIGDGGGGDSLYGGDANYGSTNPGGDGQIYGGDALYDEGAADPGIYGGDGHYGEGGMPQPGGGARYLDAAPMPDDQGWGGDDGAHLPMAPTGSDIPEYPLPEEPWFHGQITREEADG